MKLSEPADPLAKIHARQESSTVLFRLRSRLFLFRSGFPGSESPGPSWTSGETMYKNHIQSGVNRQEARKETVSPCALTKVVDEM